MSKAYLEPAGILPSHPFSWNKDTVNDIVSRNSQLNADDFYIPIHPDRPFPIVGTTLVGPLAGAPYYADTHNFTRIEMTAMYVGQMRNLEVGYKYDKDKSVHSMLVGGAIEPFAFTLKGSAPKSSFAGKERYTSTTIKVPEPVQGNNAIFYTFNESITDLHNIGLDVQLAAGASSYAVGSFFESLGPSMLSNLGMRMDYWAPASTSSNIGKEKILFK